MAKINNLVESVRNFFGWGYNYPSFSSPYEVFLPGESVNLVTPYSALYFTPVFRACNLIANDIARTTCYFENPTLERIFRRPNRFQSKYDFMRSLTLQCLLYGNSFALINRRRNGELYELVPLKVGSVSLDITGPTPVYITADYGRVEPENIIHIKATLMEGLWAMSPINLCRTALSIGLQQENTAQKQLENGSFSNIAIVHPSNISIAARQAIANDYAKNHAGSKNAGKPIILSENVRIEKISSTANEPGLDAARKYSVQDVSRIFGVPTSYLSETSGSVYGSLEWSGRAYFDACLSHWFQMWASEIDLKLNEEPYFDTDFIARPPFAEQMAALRTGIEAGIMTRNEAREYLDLDDVEGGDEFFQALNLGQGGGSTNLGEDTSEGTATGDQINGNS